MRQTCVRTLMILGVLAITSCGNFRASEPLASTNPPKSKIDGDTTSKQVTLASSMTLRTLQNNVLEQVAELTPGSVISVSDKAQTVNYKYQNEVGEAIFSSTGFIGSIRIVSSGLSQAQVDHLHSLETGLFISAVIQDQLQSGLRFEALSAAPPVEGFLTNYELNGKPKISFSDAVKKRFPNTLNKGVILSTQTSSERKKWSRIMLELQRIADRTRATDKSYLMIDPDLAFAQSIAFENAGEVQNQGAWSIAVLGTAARHGFQHVPCAEFMSEILRQAYKRAGYSHFQDFTARKGNVLDFKNGAAAVVNFSSHLEKAGWIPWDPQIYTPPTGAIIMHRSGKSPGHTYMAAGDSGRFVLDNGSPQGRDLRATSGNVIELMYHGGVFFLPPGFNPKKW